jgi:hypothetical protein
LAAFLAGALLLVGWVVRGFRRLFGRPAAAARIAEPR